MIVSIVLEDIVVDSLYSTSISTKYGEKSISVIAGNILDFHQEIDILTTSAFKHSYSPVPGTLFAALRNIGIIVHELAETPEFDLRKQCNIWLSKKVDDNPNNIRRIGCIEMNGYFYDNIGKPKSREEAILDSIKAYFQMLDIAATAGVKMDTIVMPMIGAGKQHISTKLTMIPIINECVNFLKRNEAAKKIIFIELKQQNAFLLAQTLANSYSVIRENNYRSTHNENAENNSYMAFLSYSSPDRNIADNLCAKLEAKGIKVWYAPRNVCGDYATSIANAIVKATHFIVILSKNSIASEHVLNEIDLAFQQLPNNIKFKPLRIDEHQLAPAFSYYLSRQHWMDAHIPPLEARLDEFVDGLLKDL